MNTDATTRATTPEDSRRLRRAFAPVLAFVCMLWALKLVEAAADLDFVPFGVFPRRLDGLVGVLWAPLIHGSWSHLIANTAPVLVLGTALLYGYPRSARTVLPAVYLGAGLAVWLFARPSFHIGASGLTFGVLFFVFTIGVLRWDRRAIALAMIVFFLYGSMIWGILPHDSSVSYETHLFGAVIGIVLAFALRWLDPPPPRQRYSWEDEEQGRDDVKGEPDEPSRERTLYQAEASASAGGMQNALHAVGDLDRPVFGVVIVSLVSRFLARIRLTRRWTLPLAIVATLRVQRSCRLAGLHPSPGPWHVDRSVEATAV